MQDIKNWITKLYDEMGETKETLEMIFNSYVENQHDNWENFDLLEFAELSQSRITDRKTSGTHYTNKQDILKTINPLFLQDLRQEMMRNPKAALDKISNINILDPACGSASFLIVSYIELKKLEKLQDVDNLNLTQFHGIEKAEFPALVAKTALKMAERKWSGKKTEPNIICADALEINWNAVVKSEKCTHIVGNPPFIGANTRTWAQSRQVIRIGKSGILDYAACWFVKAEQYMGNHVKTAFITTAGINRGAQVLPLWEPLFNKNMDIMFAWIPEYWNPDDAHIAVSIIGMMRNYAGKRRLFGLNTETNPKTITPYLIGMDKPMLVKETVKRKPLITMGAALWDYGHYVFNDDEMAEFISQEPLTRPYFRKFVGARDYMRGTCRNVLYLKNAPDNICNLPPVLARINMVRASRLGSRVKTNGLSPRMFLRDIPDKSYLFIPQVTSSNRSYLAVGWLNAGDYIPANCLLIPDPTLELFAMLCSKPHRIWLDVFGGKLNVDFRYNTSVYNTFPFPTKMAKVDDLAREIMAKRSNMAPEIAYNPDIMPVGLKKAHEALDVKVWKSYGLTAEPPDIIEFLITQYAKSRKNLDKNSKLDWF